MGQTKPFFVSFAYRDDSLILGRSDILSIRLPDDPNAPLTPLLPQVEHDSFATLVTMGIVSTVVMIMMVVAYAMCWGKKDKIGAEKEGES